MAGIAEAADLICIQGLSVLKTQSFRSSQRVVITSCSNLNSPSLVVKEPWKEISSCFTFKSIAIFISAKIDLSKR